MPTMTSLEPIDVFYYASASIACIFQLCLPPKLWKLSKSRPKSKAVVSWNGRLQVGLAVLLALVMFGFLTLEIPVQQQPISRHVAASLLASTVAALGLSVLLVLEQHRSHKPADLAVIYLVAAILCDGVLLTAPIPATTGILSVPGLSRNPVLPLRFSIQLALLILVCHNNRGSTLTGEEAPCPDDSANLLSKTFFFWINPILAQGFQRLLSNDELPALGQDMKAKTTRQKVLQTSASQPRDSKTWLALALFKAVKKPFLAAILPRLVLTLLRYSQPLLIKQSIRFVTSSSPSTDNTTTNHGYYLILSALTIYTGIAISTSIYQHRLNRLKLTIRSSLVGLTHDKVIHSPSIISQSTEATTLMTTDAESLDTVGEMFHEGWAQALEVLLGIVFLAREIGWIWPLPLVLIFICSRISLRVTRDMRARQTEWNKATQDRVAATGGLMGSMKMVKMLGLQRSLVGRVERLREKEMEAAGLVRWMMVYYNASANALGIFSPAFTLVVFVVIIGVVGGRRLDVETAFTAVAILSMVMHPANMIMTIMPRVNAALAGLDRIQGFLTRPLTPDHREVYAGVRLSRQPASPAISVHRLTVGVLSDVSMDVPRGSVTMISGPVGGGKTTLLSAILGETPPLVSGSIKVSTKKMAYCAQDAWLPTGTIKEIIHGVGSKESTQSDTRWYRTVTEACCLVHDFNTLPDGDETLVGSRGLNLSGGQRQRIALARALYARCEIALLDDTFSALDGDTEKMVRENLLGPRGLFRQCRTTVVLVASSTEYFTTADNVVILDGGYVTAQGKWQAIKDKVRATAIVKHGSRQSVRDNLAPTTALSGQTRDSGNRESKIVGTNDMDLCRQTGDVAIYSYYFGFAGWTNIVLLASCAAAYGFFITIPQYWLRLWTESSDDRTLFYLGGYMLVSVISWASTHGNIWFALIRLAPQSGLRTHQRLLDIVANAPLSFFLVTDSGTILNRFSQDIQYIDKQLPLVLSAIANQIFKLLMQSILLFTAQKMLVLSVPACMIVVYIVQKVYLRTSRQLRFLELESRSAVVTSFLESVEGLATMRAFGWRREAVRQNVSRLEDSQRPEFLLLSLQRWLNIVLDLVAAAVATSVIALAVASRGSSWMMSGGQVGVALNVMLVANKTLLQLVECWANLEVSLGAVARLKSLEKRTDSERSGHMLEPASSWPSRGSLEFKDVSATYPSGAVGLRGVNLSVHPGQKVIIHGRTGSGKSSLLLSLLRMLEVQYGKIELDGIDISQVPPDVLRQRCFVTVSQDALLLPDETLRFNLDPDGTLPDAFIIDELIMTGIWSQFVDSVGDIEELKGSYSALDLTLTQFPELSVGQRQLFALCRALIKARALRSWGIRAIVLLDEVTSSLDSTTESTMQGIIDKEFTQQGLTVIIVTHRLFAGGMQVEGGVSSDIVVSMADGQMQQVIRPGRDLID